MGRVKFVAASQRLLCVFALRRVIPGPVSISTAASAMAASAGVSLAGMDMSAVCDEVVSTDGDMPC